MAKNKIILFYPKTEKERSVSNIPLGVLKIGSELKGRGYDVIAIDERFDEDYARSLKEHCVDALFVGLSVMTGYQIYGALKASRMVKAFDGDIPVVWGGWHPSILPDETLQEASIDIVVRGQGEKTVSELADALVNGSPLGDIYGLVYKKDGAVIFNKPRDMEDLSTFKPLRMEMLDLNRYIFESPMGTRSVFWNSSQGCPYHCGFCSTPTVYKRKWSGLKAELLLGQVEELVGKFGVNGITFAEDNFFVDAKRVEAFAKGLVDRGIRIRWSTDVRVDQILKLSEECMDALLKSGCSKLFIGAESGDEDVLKLIDKKIGIEDTYRAAEKLYRYRIISEFFLIVGFPEDPEKDLASTLNFIRKVKERFPDHQSTPFVYTPYPGTPLFDLALRHGVKMPKGLEAWAGWDVLSVHTPWVDKRYVDKVNMFSKCIYPLAFPSTALKSEFGNGFRGRVYWVLHRLALWRVKHDFYLLPIEWKLVKLFRFLMIRFNLFQDFRSFR